MLKQRRSSTLREPARYAGPVSGRAIVLTADQGRRFVSKLPTGLNMRVENPDKADVGGYLAERPQLLGAQP